MDLSIIIVNYNVKEFLQNLIQSIYAAVSKLSYEIIIIDNASNDGSEEFIKEKFPEVTIISNKENLGFSKANNIGLKIAKGKYLLLINPDTLVREDTFSKMIEFFEKNPEAGMAGCKILNPDGTLQLACRRSFPGPWTSFTKVTGLANLFPNSKLFARYNLTYLDENQTYEVDAISGSFMMITRETYELVGGLDETFFMYGEDLDWCYRVQKAGKKVFYVHSTQIIHYKGESTKRSNLDETKVFYNAMHLFVKKHLASSLLVEFILRTAIIVREFLAFLGKRKLLVIPPIIDFIIFNLSLFIAEHIYGNFRTWSGFPDEKLWIIYTVPAFIHVFLAMILLVYRKDSLSVLRNFRAFIAGFFVLSSITFFFKDYAYSRGVLLLTYGILFFLLPLWRIVFKLSFKNLIPLSGEHKARSLIVGTGDVARKINNRLSSQVTSVHNVIGFIGDSFKDIGKSIDDKQIIGSFENVRNVIKDERIDEVIFSTAEISYSKMMEIVALCQKERVDFKLVGDNLDYLVGKGTINLLNEIPLIEINYNISQPINKIIKFIFDKSFAIFLLIFFYPFIFLFFNKKSENDFIRFILSVPLVLQGKKSFVGPKKNNYINNLFVGKLGLTGLWFTEMDNRETTDKLDLFYAKNQNIWIDLEILGKTFSKMFK